MMVNELDFEEIDQALEDMNSLDGITNAIAEDVAKIDKVVKNTTPKKSKPAKKKVVKNTTNEAKSKADKPKKPTPKQKDDTSVKTENAKPEQKNSDDGEIVMVKIKKKPVPEPEPEEVVYQPNPKTGKFMDIVSPLSDMSIQGARPLKNDIKPVVDNSLLITETSIVETTPITEPIEIDDIVADRERIENSGLDPDESIGNLADQLEDVDNNESDDPLNDILQNFDSEPVSEVADEAVDDMENDLEKLADILDIPDHSDAFLENVEITKRPLGGNEEAIGAAAIAETGLSSPSSVEAKADREFIEDTKSLNDWFNDKKETEPVVEKKAKKTSKPNKPAKKTSNVVLYVLLIVLFAILGASLGVLAYFSGLF